MSVDLVIKNGRIVTHAGVTREGIAANKGKVVAIADESLLPPANKTIDANGKYILPGLIDPHCHYGYPAPFETHLTADTQSSAAGGVTTFGHFLRSQTQSALEMLPEHKRVIEKDSLIDGLFHIIAVGGFLDDILKLPKEGVNSFKFLMGYKGLTGARGEKRGPINDGIIFDGFEKISKLGRPAWAMVHAENIELIQMLAKRLQEQGRKDMAAWEESRPYFCEAEAMRKAIYFAQITGCPLYVVHMTIGDGVDLIIKARAEGINVVAETCPWCLTHTSTEPVPLFQKYPTLGNVNPPLRNRESIEKLWQAIKDGWISTIGSDYAPVTREEKESQDIWHCIPGIGACSEMILPVMLSEGVNKRQLPLEKVAEVCSYNTAKIFGIFPEKGTIAVGSDADMVIVDLNKKVKVTPDVLHTPPELCDWTIYDGWEFTGWPVATILRGNVIVEDGKIVGKPGNAKWLHCKCE